MRFVMVVRMCFLMSTCVRAMVVPTGSPPKVSAPANFVAPTPKPLSMTRPQEQIPGLLTGGFALAIRLATGVFTLGWTPQLLNGAEAEKVGVDSGVCESADSHLLSLRNPNRDHSRRGAKRTGSQPSDLE